MWGGVARATSAAAGSQPLWGDRPASSRATCGADGPGRTQAAEVEGERFAKEAQRRHGKGKVGLSIARAKHHALSLDSGAIADGQPGLSHLAALPSWQELQRPTANS